jgi:hypothetical protein
MQLRCHTIPIDLMHNEIKIEQKAKIQTKRQVTLVKCTGACLDPKLG